MAGWRPQALAALITASGGLRDSSVGRPQTLNGNVWITPLLLTTTHIVVVCVGRFLVVTFSQVVAVVTIDDIGCPLISGSPGFESAFGWLPLRGLARRALLSPVI